MGAFLDSISYGTDNLGRLTFGVCGLIGWIGALYLISLLDNWAWWFLLVPLFFYPSLAALLGGAVIAYFVATLTPLI